MSLGKILDRLIYYHAQALMNDDILKPFSWALYQTWKWADKKEDARSENE